MQKRLGIIGGAGPLASSLFYETIVQESYQRGNQFPEIILINYPFTRGLTLLEREKNKGLLNQELYHCLKILKGCEVEIAVLVCNTLHIDLFQIPQDPILFLSIPSLVLENIREKGHQRLLLLGTQNTCRSSLYQQAGITLLCPSMKDQQLIDEVIDRVLEGKILEEDSLLVSHLIQTFSESIDGVILGCTDLPVLHHSFPLCCDKHIYDSVKIPAKSTLGYL